MPRRTTAAGRLARLGFADPARAELHIEDLAMDPGRAREALIGALGTAAEPDLALAALARMPRDAELARATTWAATASTASAGAATAPVARQNMVSPS